MTSKGGTLRILALEYITGGGHLGRELPPGIAREGDAILTALLRDLAEIDGMSAVATRDPRLAPPPVPGEFVAAEGEIWEFWRRMMAGADALWPVAPETHGRLTQMSRLAAGKTLIGSAPETVSIASSRRRTADLLAAHGIAAVPTAPVPGSLPPSDTGYVAKPDDGVSAQDTRVFESGEELAAFFAEAGDAGRFVVQPYLRGVDASISAVFRGGEALVLACNRQGIARANGAFHYSGFDVGALEEMRGDFESITERVARAMPGLHGFAGIDLVITDGGPVVLEINPRLTTPYAGLSEALGENAARLVLDYIAGKDISGARPRRVVSVAVEAHV